MAAASTTLEGMDRVAPTRRPAGPPKGYQKWRRLLFVHWEVPVSALRPLIPAALDIDTFEGRAYVGIVPFTMRDVRPRGLPAVSLVSDFHECNVRTYVHLRGRDPGVWFFSLEAAKSLPVRLARRFWHLPYFRAEMSMDGDERETTYRTERRWPAPVPASFHARYRVGDPLGSARVDTFEHFLCERYFLYADGGTRGLLRGQVHHTPYPLRAAELLECEEHLLVPAELPPANGAPISVLYSPGVDVEVFSLASVATR